MFLNPTAWKVQILFIFLVVNLECVCPVLSDCTISCENPSLKWTVWLWLPSTHKAQEVGATFFYLSWSSFYLVIFNVLNFFWISCPTCQLSVVFKYRYLLRNKRTIKSKELKYQFPVLRLTCIKDTETVNSSAVDVLIIYYSCCILKQFL
jgi:hypothetical protein